MSVSMISSLSNLPLCKQNKFPTPLVQYIFNSSYVSSGYLKNYTNNVYDLNLQSTTLTTISGKNCINTISSYATVSTSVTNNATTILSTSTNYPAITVTFWIYANGSTNAGGIWSINNTNNNTYWIEIQMGSATSVMLWISPGAIWVTIGNVTANTWNMVTLVYDGYNYSTYLNTTAGAFGVDTSTTNATIINVNRNYFYIGKENAINTFQGYIADLRLYGVALTPTQITIIYNNGIKNS